VEGLVGKRARNRMRVARIVRNHWLPLRTSPSLPKNTEVLRDPLSLRAYVPMGEVEEEGAETLRSVFAGVGRPQPSRVLNY
jgi:hypothetical protein